MTESSDKFRHDSYTHKDEVPESVTVPDLELQYDREGNPSLNEIFDAIHDPQEGKPRLEINTAAQGRLLALQKRMATITAQGRRVSVINVRCGGKTLPELKILLTRLKALEQHLPSLAGVLLTLNPQWEKKVGTRMTERALEHLYGSHDSDLPLAPVIPIPVEGYSFTSALNGGLALTEAMARQSGIDSSRVMIVPMSFDVEIPAEEAMKFEQAIQSQSDVLTARILPNGERPFPGDADVLFDLFQRMLRDPGSIHAGHRDLGSNEPALHDAYKQLSLGRNTFQAHQVDHFTARGGVNPLCDAKPHDFLSVDDSIVSDLLRASSNQINGMEDREYWESRISDSVKSVRLAVINIVNYQDHAMLSQSAYNVAKAEREIVAAQLVAKGVAEGVAIGTGSDRREIRFVDGIIPRELREFRMGDSLVLTDRQS